MAMLVFGNLDSFVSLSCDCKRMRKMEAGTGGKNMTTGYLANT